MNNALQFRKLSAGNFVVNSLYDFQPCPNSSIPVRPLQTFTNVQGYTQSWVHLDLFVRDCKIP